MNFFKILYFLCIYSVQSRAFDNLSRIIEGYDCSPEDYPYIVSIMIKQIYHHICGGSVVKPLWVLTAAHCCIYYARQLIVISGTQSVQKVEASQEVPVLTCYRHPEYHDSQHDIGLLRLQSKLHESDKIKYISLSFEEFTPTFGKSCRNTLIIGYGQQTKTNVANQLIEPLREDKKLKCGNVTVIPDIACDQMIERQDSHFCAMDLSDKHQDACFGDSGSPVICNGKQIGIVSAGFGCGYDLPGLYTKVSPYKEFIDYVITNGGWEKLNTNAIFMIYIFQHVFLAG